MTLRSDRKAISFEEAVFSKLNNLVAGLAPGCAAFSTWSNTPNYPQRYAMVSPTCPSAAKIVVGVISTDLHLTIGEVEQEVIAFETGGVIIPRGTWSDDFCWLWNAVTSAKFAQKQYLSSDGAVVGGASVLRWNGYSFDFRGGRVADSVFGPRRSRNVFYDPY